MVRLFGATIRLVLMDWHFSCSVVMRKSLCHCYGLSQVKDHSPGDQRLVSPPERPAQDSMRRDT